MTIYIEPHQCPSHQSILLTQGPIYKILAEIAQLLVVVEKLSFFESAILKQLSTFASNLLLMNELTDYVLKSKVVAILNGI